MISEKCARSRMRAALVLLVFGIGIVAVSGASIRTASAQSAVERPPTFSASQLLRGQNLTGPNYQISETVQNDGFLNHYTVTVEGRSYNVAGNATMRERLRELRALQRMEAMKRTDVYKKALKKSALGPLSTAKNMVMSPVSTIKGIGSGIGSMFSSVGHSLFGGASDQEEGVLKTAIGFAAAKRKFAHRFGIDPYTSFPPVKERLDEIAWSGVAGGLTVGVAFAAIPGVGGTVVSTTKTSDTMNNVIRDNTPAELKKNDGRKLRAMGVHKSVAAIFLEHPKYSPSERTRLVSALASVAATGREEFIQRASLAANETMAIFLRRWAEMIAAYNRRIQPVKRIIRIGKAPFAQRADGVLVGLFPIDYLAWTTSIARRHATNMKSLPGVSGVTAGEIWFEGGISPKAKQALIAQNWVVNEYTGAALGLK